MNNTKNIISSQAGIIGIFVLLSVMIFSFSIKSGLKDISILTNAQGISVSGTASREVKSDKGTLSLNIEASSLGSSKEVAQRDLSQNLNGLTKYLASTGIKEESITVSPFYSSEECTERSKGDWANCVGTTYQKYAQSVSVSSSDVDKIKDLSVNINQNLSNNPKYNVESSKIAVSGAQYFYSKFDSIKSEMLNEATKNAFERAEAIAKSTGNRAGEVITASQGVFQVTSRDSIDSQDYGSYDTSTIDKKVTAVVRVSFKVK